jgi:hypothetical protein
MSASITDRVNSIAEDLQEEDTMPFSERHFLDVGYEVRESGDVQEVTLTLTVGGPHIEVECLSGVVAGYWGGESYRRGIESQEVKEYGRMLAEQMESRID